MQQIWTLFLYDMCCITFYNSAISKQWVKLKHKTFLNFKEIHQKNKLNKPEVYLTGPCY